jgi:hypothetical protein
MIFKALLEKEKHGATFTTLENNLISNRTLIDVKNPRPNAVFRFTPAARADLLPTPANVEQWYRKPRTSCQRCGRDAMPTLAHILNGCQGNFKEMTKRHNRVVEVVRKAIVENLRNKMYSGIGENVAIEEEGLSEEVRRLRPDLNFVANFRRTLSTVLIDVSCPFGRISHGVDTLKKVYVDKLAKYADLARELQRLRHMPVQIIPVIVSSLGAVFEDSFKELDELLLCNTKMKGRLGKQLSDAAIMGSFQLWHGYTKEMANAEDPRVGRHAAQEALITDEEQKYQQVGEEQRDRSEQESGTGEGGRREVEHHNLSDELEVEGGDEDEAEDEDDEEDHVEDVQMDSSVKEAVREIRRARRDGQYLLGYLFWPMGQAHVPFWNVAPCHKKLSLLREDHVEVLHKFRKG